MKPVISTYIPKAEAVYYTASSKTLQNWKASYPRMQWEPHIKPFVTNRKYNELHSTLPLPKLLVADIVKKFPVFMQLVASLPYFLNLVQDQNDAVDM